jgi:hypothetical protein
MAKGIAYHLVIVTISAPNIVPSAWTIIIAPSSIIISGPITVDKNGIVPVVVTSGGTINTYVQRRSQNGRRTSEDLALNRVDTPRQRGQIDKAYAYEQK